MSSDLGSALHAWAARYGERPAAIGEHGSLSFVALDRAADAWTATLRTAGCGAGARVGLLAGNSPAWLAVAFGVWRAGATLVPISTFVTARELAELLAHADLETLVMQPRLRSHDYAAMLDTFPSKDLPLCFILDPETQTGGGGPPRPPARAEHGREPSGRGGPPPLVSRPGQSTELVPVDPEAIACILYTSGTTGAPKGVMLSHRAIVATVAPTSERSGLTPDDVLLSTLPLFWVAGLVIRALPTLAAGCALALIEAVTTESLLAALRRHRPTALHLRPPQVGQLLSHGEFDPALLAGVRRGGGRVEWFHPHLDPERTRFTTGYGMTETAGYVTALDWRDPPSVRASQIGTPLPDVEIRIVDAAGVRCAAGERGEVRVRSTGLFSGYHKQPPASGLDADGFFMTGDVGSVGADGVFQFHGRSKDLLRVKGINVSPVEVETVLAAHPSVDAVYVVGLPADGLDQEVVALIVSRGDEALSEDELRALAARELSHYKRPAHYVAIAHDEVPLGSTAKPQRAALAALAVQRLNNLDLP